jgi:hypothetical protein
MESTRNRLVVVVTIVGRSDGATSVRSVVAGAVVMGSALRSKSTLR